VIMDDSAVKEHDVISQSVALNGGDKLFTLLGRQLLAIGYSSYARNDFLWQNTRGDGDGTCARTAACFINPCHRAQASFGQRYFIGALLDQLAHLNRLRRYRVESRIKYRAHAPFHVGNRNGSLKLIA